MLPCLLTSAVDLHHLVKVVSLEFLHCKVAISLFLINKYLKEDILRLCKYPVSSQTFAHNFSLHHGSCLQ